jgi:hypothetical protein
MISISRRRHTTLYPVAGALEGKRAHVAVVRAMASALRRRCELVRAVLRLAGQDSFLSLHEWQG